jgi:hypothetical protein
MPHPLAHSADLQPLVVAGVIGAVTLTLVGLVVGSEMATRREQAAIGGVLASLGLERHSSLFGGPRYRGVLAGRPIEARSTPRRRYAPAMLEITIASPVQVAFALELRHLHGTYLGVIEGELEVPIEGPEKQRLVARAPEIARSGRALRDPSVMAAIVRLFDEGLGPPSITIAPGTVTLGIAGITPESLHAEVIRSRALDLVALAHALEALPPS